MITEHKTCRLCGSRATRRGLRGAGSDLRWILGLGSHHVVDFLKPGQVTQARQRPRVPLNLVQCPECGLVQLTHSVAADRLFEHFWYRSGVNESMVAALDDVAASVESLTPTGGTVLDIGCNDGTLMRQLKARGLRPAGIDPAENVVSLAAAYGPSVQGYFNTGKAFEAARSLGGKRFDAITSVAMFYDLDEPLGFLLNVRLALAPRGVFICQQNYLKAMVEKLAWDNICHEHVCYWSVSTMQRALQKARLELFDVEFNEVNGGSFRVYAGHPGERPVEPAVSEAIEAESSLDLTEFEDRVRESISMIKLGLTRLPRPIWIYGASTRGSTLLQALDLRRSFFAGAAERDHRKFGRVTAGTWIPITHEEVARKEAASFLVLPWHFRDSILRRERDWLSAGGQMLFPLPEAQLVTGEAAA